MPADFGLPDDKETIKKALLSGRWAIDWWEGIETEEYFVRPATKGMEGKMEDPSWGGECTFLTPTGCALSCQERPWACRVLEPRKDGCITHGLGGTNTKEDAAHEWAPYQELLEDIYYNNYAKEV